MGDVHKDRLAQGLFGSFNKSYFDLIHDFMHNIPCFNPPQSQDLVDLKDDVYHKQPYPPDDLSFHEEIQMCENAIERVTSPLPSNLDPILHNVKAFQERYSWAMPSIFKLLARIHQFKFYCPPS